MDRRHPLNLVTPEKPYIIATRGGKSYHGPLCGTANRILPNRRRAVGMAYIAACRLTPCPQCLPEDT